MLQTMPCIFESNIDFSIYSSEMSVSSFPSKSRQFFWRLAQFAAVPVAMAGGFVQGQAMHKPLKIMMKSAWGSDDPTKAAFPKLEEAIVQAEFKRVKARP